MKILVAEDERDLNRVIVKKLRNAGYEVDSCADGAEALYNLEIGEYDAAVLDIMMPELDGLEVVKRLRAEGGRTPVIFLTARDTLQDKIKGLDIGASDYIVKPFSFEELIARLKAVLRTSKGDFSETLELDDLVLDLNTCSVHRGGEEIELTRKEFRLLEYLMMNQGRVLSREKIENHVWGLDYEGGTNILDVYLSYLRKKIDAGREVKLIHTVRGIGYVMRVNK